MSDTPVVIPEVLVPTVWPALGAADYNQAAYAAGNSLPPAFTRFGLVAQACYKNATYVFGAVTAAEAAKADAQAAAVAAANASNASKWVAGTTYAAGAAVWSPINYQGYRRKNAGAGAIDPSQDTTNWALLGAVGTLPDFLLFSQGVI
jgi:hypothetical protein